MRALWLLFCSGCCAFSAPVYRGPSSDHFDGARFLPPLPFTRGVADLVRWRMDRHQGSWHETFSEPGARPPARVGLGELRVTFVNHSTVLLQLDGMNFLTDPIWSQRCSPVDFLGPARVRPPGLRFEDLPPIDGILLSHDHYDHTDLPTLRRLTAAYPRARIYTGLGNRALLRSSGIYHVYEMDWWQEIRYGRVSIVGVPAQHTSGRGLCDRDGTLYLGFVLRGAAAGAIFFAGDTGYSPHFVQIRERLGSMRLAVLPIGAYRPEWFMSPMHMSPAQAVQAARDLQAGTSVAMHFGTFQLGDDGQDEPPIALRAALSDGERFWVLGFGEGRDVP